jgi:hypothetical protein
MIFGIFKGKTRERLRATFTDLRGHIGELNARLARMTAGSKAEAAALRARLAQVVQERDVLTRENAVAREQMGILSVRLREVEAQVPASKELKRLIPFLKNLKREVLDLRQENAMLGRERDCLRQELDKRAALAEGLARPEDSGPWEEMARLKKENGVLRIKAGQQEQLIRSLKDVETRYKLLKKRLPGVQFTAQPPQVAQSR